MCLFQAFLVQAFCNQDPGTLILNTGWHYVYIGTCIQSGFHVLISLVVWLQSVGKISIEMKRCGKHGIILCLLVNRKIHCWRSDHLTGHILNLLAHTLLPLATDVL